MLKADVRTELSLRLYTFILSSCKRIDMASKVIIQAEFLLCFHAPSVISMEKWKRNIRRFDTSKRRNSRKLPRTESTSLLLHGLAFFSFVYFFAKHWLYCLYPAHYDDNPNIGVPYFTKGHSVKGISESPLSFEVISSIEFTPYFPRKHLGHYGR